MVRRSLLAALGMAALLAATAAWWRNVPQASAPPAPVRLRVQREPRGPVVAGAEVWHRIPQANDREQAPFADNEAGYLRRYGMRATTDERGEVVLPPGSRALVRHGNMAAVSGPTTGTLVLRPVTDLTLLAVNQDGQPVAGVPFTASPPDSWIAPATITGGLFRTRLGTTDADGRLVVPCFANERPGSRWIDAVDLAAVPTAPLRFALPPFGTVTCQVTGVGARQTSVALASSSGLTFRIE